MQTRYFADADTLVLVFSDREVVDNINENVLVETDTNGNVVSITIEHATQQTKCVGVGRNHAMTEDIIRETVLRHYPAVQAVYLYGSHGTPDEWPQSDVDVALLLPYPQAKTEPPLALSPCRAALEEALGRPADLVNLRTANTVFQNEVVTTGRRIVVQDANAMHDFEGLALSFLLKLNEERREILDAFARTKRAYDV